MGGSCFLRGLFFMGALLQVRAARKVFEDVKFHLSEASTGGPYGCHCAGAIQPPGIPRPRISSRINGGCFPSKDACEATTGGCYDACNSWFSLAPGLHQCRPQPEKCSDGSAENEAGYEGSTDLEEDPDVASLVEEQVTDVVGADALDSVDHDRSGVSTGDASTDLKEDPELADEQDSDASFVEEKVTDVVGTLETHSSNTLDSVGHEQSGTSTGGPYGCHCAGAIQPPGIPRPRISSRINGGCFPSKDACEATTGGCYDACNSWFSLAPGFHKCRPQPEKCSDGSAENEAGYEGSTDLEEDPDVASLVEEKATDADGMLKAHSTNTVDSVQAH